MGDPSATSASETPSQRFPPAPESVARARRFVRTALEEAVPGAMPDLLDTAEFLTGELVTNAVLHAGTEIGVAAGESGGRIRVAVLDHRPSRMPVARECPPYAGIGQGLVLVSRLASLYGVETGDGTKTVWFELWPDGARHPSAWELPAPPAGPAEPVVLVDVPGALYSASQQHRQVLLRELKLAEAAGRSVVPPRDLATAHDISNVISECVTAALRDEPAEGEIRSLPLAMRPGAAPAVEALSRVLDAGERAAREERLLTLPALPRSRVFHTWLFDEITGQLAGARPTAWTVVPREPGAGPAELVPWDPGHVRTSRVPTIAADEQNRIIAVNGPAAGLLGWDPEELVGQPLTALIPEHLRGRHVKAFTSLLLSGEPHILGRSVPLPALHREGRLVPVRLFIQTQETADGRTVFVAQLSPRAATPGPTARRPGARRSAGHRDQAPAPDGRGAPGLPPVAAPRPGTAQRREAVLPVLERLSLLAETGAAMSNASDLDDGLQRVCRILTERFADWCAVDLLTEDARVERACVARRGPGAPYAEDLEGMLPPLTDTARGPLARALSGAGPLLLTEPPEHAGMSPLDVDYGRLFERLGADSAVVIPLRARQETIGVLTVARTGREWPFTEEELPLVDDLGHALALGVDNARLHQETRNIAEQLQRSLLPVLPAVRGLDLAARYAASSTTAQVGGDWYDSFVLPTGDLALVIGDVAGHNLDAAIAMSQLRSMLRGIAVDRREPPETVLRRLDMANHSLSREATATCVYGLLKGAEEGPWEFVHSSAGHLPPLLVMDDGRTRYLENGSGLLLGMDPDMLRPRAEDAVPADATVLLYTDGLIERRDESLDEAMGRLGRHAAELARESLDVFCDELLIGLGADNTDDIAILAVRPVSPS
ncbi:PAS domain S-box protein [Streptomyces nitrosporeus]|uniref:protein-serine/threonine phosphatase n=1 Tax=Streptomyces nitrosporeus TaxID=28894 RepID=A0A5J6FK57_9ACTN|nr:SpoIIE family protein phosphatase [Streptomyces nitrosporeus]QEU75375.1 PAS domain S-box protein [Streptomyces nitrosporeus]